MSLSARNLLRLLDLLFRQTDADHPMGLGEIVRRLNKGGESVSVRAVRRALDDITACRDELEYEEHVRRVFDKAAGEYREEVMRTNYYLTHAFTDGELHFLMDQVRFSPQIPRLQRQELLTKLQMLASTHFQMHQLQLPQMRQANCQMFLNIELVGEAVRKERRIALGYLTYNVHKQLTERIDESGSPRRHVLSPYSLAMMDGRYYLICNNDRFEGLSHYRLDRMHDVQILEQPIRPLSSLRTSYGGVLELETYWQQHAYMMAGDHVRVRLRLDRNRIDCLLDVFGDEAELMENRGEVQAIVRAGRGALLQFLRIHSPNVEVLEPQEFRRAAAENLKEALQPYISAGAAGTGKRRG